MRVGWRLVVGSVAVALIVAACGGTDETDSSPGDTAGPGEDPPTTTTASTSGTSASTGDPAPEGERVYYAYQNGRIVAVDPDAGELVEIMVIDPAAGQVTSVTQGGGSMWLTTDSASVLRVNLDRREVEETIALGSSATPFAAAYGEGALWVLHGIPGLGEAVSRVDSDSNTVDLTVTPPDGLSFFEVAVGDGAVWVIGSGTEMATVLYEIDPATGEFTVHEVAAFMRDVAVGEGGVWVVGTFFDENFVASNGVGRFDAASGVLDVVETDGETWTLGVGSGGVWATLGIQLGGAELVRVDPASLSVTDTLGIGETFSGNIDVTFGAGFVWVHKIASFDGAIYVIDPTGPEVVGSGDSPTPYGLVFP